MNMMTERQYDGQKKKETKWSSKHYSSSNMIPTKTRSWIICSGMVINSLSTHCVWRVSCPHYGYYHDCGFQKSVDKLYGILIKHYIIRKKPNIGSYWLMCLENIMPYQLMTCFVYFEKACAHKHYWSSCYPSRASAFTPGF